MTERIGVAGLRKSAGSGASRAHTRLTPRLGTGFKMRPARRPKTMRLRG